MSSRTIQEARMKAAALQVKMKCNENWRSYLWEYPQGNWHVSLHNDQGLTIYQHDKLGRQTASYTTFLSTRPGQFTLGDFLSTRPGQFTLGESQFLESFWNTANDIFQDPNRAVHAQIQRAEEHVSKVLHTLQAAQESLQRATAPVEQSAKDSAGLAAVALLKAAGATTHFAFHDHLRTAVDELLAALRLQMPVPPKQEELKNGGAQ